jgi:hypothetical protein
MSVNKEALTDTKLAFSTRRMALAWMLDVPEGGADCMFSFRERICQNGQTSVSPAVGQMQGRSRRASNDRLACGAGEFRDDLNAPSRERYFQARNAPYFLNDLGNPLKSQEMRSPSERTSGKSRNIFPSRYSQVGLRTWIVLVPSFPLTAWRRREAGRWSQRSARGVARAASQIDLQLLELGDALIDAPLPYLVQRSPDLRR